MEEETPVEALAEFKEVIEDIAAAAHEECCNKPEGETCEPCEAAEPCEPCEEGAAGEGGGEEEAAMEDHPAHAKHSLGGEGEEEIDIGPREISPEEHEENIEAMEDVLDHVLDLAAEGKLPMREEKSEFEMKTKIDSTEELMAVKTEEIEVSVIEDEFSPLEESLEEMETEEEEEEESASVQEAWHRRQNLIAEFDAAHDEAQRLRIMNMLLHSRVLRLMQRRPKKKSGFSSTASTLSRGTPTPSIVPSVADITGLAETLEKELLEAGEVRRQLDAETHHGAAEEELRRRLSAAREGVQERAALLQQLQDKALSKLHAPPVRRQEAEQMLKRVWPQLLRLRKERLLYTRAMHDLEAAQQEVSKLEVFGPNRTVAAYEQLTADGVKLAERVQERADQLAALRNIADRDLQQAAHLREALQGAHQDVVEARRSDARTTLFLQKARKEVLKLKKKRDSLYKENTKLTKKMELLAYPDLLHDHQEVVWRLPVAQGELSQLRAAYLSQEQRIATARHLLQQREQSLRGGRPPTPEPEPSFLVLNMDAKCGPSLLQVRHSGQGPVVPTP